MMEETVKHEITIIPGVDPREAAKALVNIKDDADLRAVMNRLEPSDAARVIAHAPDIQAQTRLIWSMDKPQRAATLDHLAPVTVAAIVQNQERRNRRLLGDISLEHFARILEFCSSKQRYYWLALANSFADVGANLLILLLPPKDVAEALLTVPEFRRKRHTLRRFLPGGFDPFPPVEDRRLKAVLVRLAEYDGDRYKEVLETACAMVEEAREQSDTFAELESEPIILPRIPHVPPLMPEEAPVTLDEDEGDQASHPLVPVPLPDASDSLMRAAASKLPPARRQSLQHEIEKLFRDEVMAQGGSVAMSDLERAAAKLQAYLRLGLRDVPEDPEKVADILTRVRAGDVVQRGITALEQLRQIALRLRPFAAVMDLRQRDLLLALVHPEATIEPKSGEAALRVPALDRRRRPEAIPVANMHEHLADISVWVAISRALGVRALTEKLASAPNGSLAVLAALAVSLITRGCWDPETLEMGSLRAFRDEHFDRKQGTWKPGLKETARQKARAWVAQSGIDPSLQPRAVLLIMAALDQLEEFLRTRRVITWERFAPGKRASRRAGGRGANTGGNPKA